MPIAASFRGGVGATDDGTYNDREPEDVAHRGDEHCCPEKFDDWCVGKVKRRRKLGSDRKRDHNDGECPEKDDGRFKSTGEVALITVKQEVNGYQPKRAGSDEPIKGWCEDEHGSDDNIAYYGGDSDDGRGNGTV